MLATNVHDFENVSSHDESSGSLPGDTPHQFTVVEHTNTKNQSVRGLMDPYTSSESNPMEQLCLVFVVCHFS